MKKILLIYIALLLSSGATFAKDGKTSLKDARKVEAEAKRNMREMQKIANELGINLDQEILTANQNEEVIKAREEYEDAIKRATK